MRVRSILPLFVSLVVSAWPAAAADVDQEVASRFASLALECVQKEYPNKIAHVMYSDADAKSPRQLTPSFYGCYDWHSAVHGHWMLARLARRYPEAPFAAPARKALAANLTPAKIAVEVKYLEGEGRASFERPYGLAWLLQLGAELRAWDDPEAQRWSAALAPLERATASRLATWLPKLSHPVRSGEHSQSAFALGLILDWARVSGEKEFETLVASRIRSFYLNDRDCPLEYEPSGEDFVSPCIAEADVMRRVLEPAAYAAWLGPFLPRLGTPGWIVPAVVTDASDGKLVHLDGLNLSRAWMLEGIASGLPSDDPRRAALLEASQAHGTSGLAAVSDVHYEGGHWLGSFATYYATQRGIGQ